MIPNSGQRKLMAGDHYARRAPFSRIVEIMTAWAREGIEPAEEEILGTLSIFPPAERAMEVELPYAYHEMLERAPRVVVRSVEIMQSGVNRTVYVVVAEDEADEKVNAFIQWANNEDSSSEFFTRATRHTIGWWALGYQVAWALTVKEAEEIIRKGFQTP